ncbi:hypothetical protein CAPTEDRAFT_168488 [Capitella teleta]|uniref:C2HC/C3H-type domain-containing protein n=1 Tax=Capitella teleta TaxID=283909 RepID=R7UT82_CAPTE|nr:hypothetical protein CAPTEDRAFT_168488 [Capitella teleta]|eukprot:ELU07117.1 hypothetical protein CAPTEDRAFT_168488 [Capitella teleta]
MEYDAFSSTNSQQLIPCNNCGRNFNPEALQRHAPICSKAKSKPRRVFDSSKQRLEGTEAAPLKGRARQRQAPAPQPKKSNWREQHEDFINAIRSAKGVQKAIDSGGPLPPPPPPSRNPDYISCQYCDRRFNAKAAERHIPFCAEQHSRLPNKKQPDATALRRAGARQEYKAPKPKSRSGGGGPGTYSYPAANSGPSGIRTMKYATSSSGGAAPPKGQGSSQKQAGLYPGFKGMNGSHGNNGSSESPGSGRALRTGRTAETYSEARQLSAKQRGSATTATSRFPNDRMTNSEQEDPRLTTIGNSYGGTGNSQGSLSRGSSGRAGSGGGLAKFCHECGTKFPVPNARFCVECGCKRPTMT